MKTLVTLVALFVVTNVHAASPEVEAARTSGAKGQVTLRVVDSKGSIVTNATVNVGFYNPRKGDEAAQGLTDTTGLFVATGTPVEDMSYAITKAGYYKTEGKYLFYRRIETPLIDGHWQPWNPVVTVVLKEQRNPIPMYAKPVDTTVPLRDSGVGFDFEVGDWVAPHGQGKIPDVHVNFRTTIQDKWTFSKELTIACSNRLDGFCRMKKDTGSEFLSMYEAPTNGYLPVLNFGYNATKYKVLRADELGQSEYLIFRVRTVLDDSGHIVSTHYGKIYGPIEYGAGKDQRFRFTYYLNPTVGDRNLEFDPARNLFGDTNKRRVYRR
jgi:hypothetical protein